MPACLFEGIGLAVRFAERFVTPVREDGLARLDRRHRPRAVDVVVRIGVVLGCGVGSQAGDRSHVVGHLVVVGGSAETPDRLAFLLLRCRQTLTVVRLRSRTFEVGIMDGRD